MTAHLLRASETVVAMLWKVALLGTGKAMATQMMAAKARAAQVRVTRAMEATGRQ